MLKLSGKIASMQLLLNSSKYLILAVLSCFLLIAWNNDDIDFTGWEVVTRPHSIKSVSSHNSSRSQAKPVVVDSIWNSIGSELKLDHRAQNSRVKAEIRKLLADEGKLYQILKAAGPYIYFIHKQIQARGLPTELALIPVIESEFNPNDRSRVGATGLWQLMPRTARELGVKVKSGYDGRRNVVASTKAALAYFKDLGNLFKGNWYLAIAAYNCGQVKVASLQRRTGSHSFWNLPLPRETKLYVPKLLAVAAIVKNPEKYGIELPHVNNAPYFTELKVKKSVNLAQVAKSSGISTETLRTLNPDYRHGKIIPKKEASLLVPVNKAPEVKAHLAGALVVSSKEKQV